MLFNSRNNGYAISTPTSEQYRGDGIGLYFLMCVAIVHTIKIMSFCITQQLESF